MAEEETEVLETPEKDAENEVGEQAAARPEHTSTKSAKKVRVE